MKGIIELEPPGKSYLHGYDIPLLFRDLVVGVGVLADHSVQAGVGHLGVAGAGEVHGQNL